MEEWNLPPSSDVAKLAKTLDEALTLIAEFSSGGDVMIGTEQNPASLLDQCLVLCNQQKSASKDPVRTLHHFACTGGTLISKCLAAMPNTQLLSEIDPLSTIQHKPQKPRFAPTDIVQLMRQSTRGTNDELVTELFLTNLDVIYKNTVLTGQHLVLRDHAHGHFCVGVEVEKRPDFRKLIQSRFPVVSVVTVRHPLDSYLSLKKNGWIHYTPATLNEYCKRYLAFLDTYNTVPIIKYEDFVESPGPVMNTICKLLELPYSDLFTELFDIFSLTGDSGRKTGVIEEKPRRPIEDNLMAELNTSPNYEILKSRLGYVD